MGVAAKSRNSFHIEILDFKEVVFSFINCLPIAKYTFDELIARNYFQVINCTSTKKYWFFVLGKELK